MKLRDVFRFADRILLEYDNTKSGVTLAAPGGKKASMTILRVVSL